jgi:hypothetical protein
MRCTVRHGRKKDGLVCGVWAFDKILFAEKTCRKGAKKPALNFRFAPESDCLLCSSKVTLRAITRLMHRSKQRKKERPPIAAVSPKFD